MVTHAGRATVAVSNMIGHFQISEATNYFGGNVPGSNPIIGSSKVHGFGQNVKPCLFLSVMHPLVSLRLH